MLGMRTDHGRRDRWTAALDPGLWRQVLAAGTAGAVSMAVLACAVTLARGTTDHDWYAAARVTAADILIATGFDGNAPVEYRRADGAVETMSRYGMTLFFEARWARQDILAAARDGAMPGGHVRVRRGVAVPRAGQVAHGRSPRPAFPVRAGARAPARGAGAVCSAAAHDHPAEPRDNRSASKPRTSPPLEGGPRGQDAKRTGYRQGKHAGVR